MKDTKMQQEYTAEERKQMAKCFKEAKKYLAKDVEEHRKNVDKEIRICYAISATNVDRKTRRACRLVILRRLEGFCCFEEWLLNQGVSEEALSNSTALQAHRHAWLDLLIKEFSK